MDPKRIINMYESLIEAIAARNDLVCRIDTILNRDLEMLDESERSIGRWFGLLGNDPDFRETAEEIDSLHIQLVDTEKFISAQKTVADLDNSHNGS